MIEPIRLSGPPLHIEGFPDAVKVVLLSDAKAYRLADLMLHKVDLEFARDSLAAINSASPGFQREVYWRSAIVQYFKCFGESDSRFSLTASQVYKGQPAEALQNFEYFKDLRNKHLIHDENALAQCMPGAVLNDGSKPYKVEKIVTIAMLTATLEQNAYSNFELLIGFALGWVGSQFEALAKSLTTDLEQEAYEDLLARPAITYTMPSGADISKNRARAAGSLGRPYCCFRFVQLREKYTNQTTPSKSRGSAVAQLAPTGASPGTSQTPGKPDTQ